MHTFRLRSKIASAWSLDVVGMSLGECIDYIRECWLAAPTDCIVVWDAAEIMRIAEITHRGVWVCRAWRDRIEEYSQGELCERYHEKY